MSEYAMSKEVAEMCVVAKGPHHAWHPFPGLLATQLYEFLFLVSSLSLLSHWGCKYNHI